MNLDFLSSILEGANVLVDFPQIPKKSLTTLTESKNIASNKENPVSELTDSILTARTDLRTTPRVSNADSGLSVEPLTGNICFGHDKNYLSVKSVTFGVFDIYQLADLELTPIISTLTETAYLSLEWGGLHLAQDHPSSNPSGSPRASAGKTRAELHGGSSTVPPINTIKLEQREKTLRRVSVPLERTPPICRDCVFWKAFNGTSRACSKKNLETHEFFLCDVADPREVKKVLCYTLRGVTSNAR
jgi:hypothetical protein